MRFVIVFGTLALAVLIEASRFPLHLASRQVTSPTPNDNTTREVDSVAKASAKVSNQSLQLPPLPNPYPLPDSDLSIDFEEPTYFLLARDVVDCFTSARAQIRRYMHRHPDRPIPLANPPLTYIWRSVKFLFYPESTRRGFTFKDLLAVLDAFALKSSHEGYLSRRGFILADAEAQHVGRALLLPALASSAAAPLHQETTTTIVAQQQQQPADDDADDAATAKTRRSNRPANVGSPSSSSSSSPLHLHPLPNPYPLPNTNKELLFDAPGLPIRPADAAALIQLVLGETQLHIRLHRDGAAPPYTTYHLRDLVFFAVNEHPLADEGEEGLTYGDLVE
ncbi:MAG: hypothetical protein Q9202_007543, partial [Teloschistes flavicans]